MKRFLPAFLLLLSSCVLCAQYNHASSHEKLGTVLFPISCVAESQKPFERGVALLHSFEYEEADQQFQQIAKSDPQCAMAYWGQAMSLYHQLWSRPTKSDLLRGRELVQRAEQTKAAMARERDYIGAIAAFYRDSETKDHDRRGKEYSRAMEKLYHRYPSDHEAAAFYALSLLATGSTNDLKAARKAIAVLQPLLVQGPDHPGIAHYIIHACDSPELAQTGLPAAKQYAAIAASSPHAVHMPSHIFARLGMWQEDIESNQAAINAAQEQSSRHMHVAHHELHSLDFMEYSYLQLGENAKAKALIQSLSKIQKSDVPDGLNDYFDSFPVRASALYAIETREWKEAVALQSPTDMEPYSQASTYWARAIGAGHLHDAAVARAAAAKFSALVEATRKSSKPFIADYMKTNQDESESWALFAEGKTNEALRILRGTADKQDKVGKGEVEVPAREMLADMLLEMKRPQEALVEYEKSLHADPNRFNGLYGAARAAELSNHPEKAAEYKAQLLKNRTGPDVDRPELAQVSEQMGICY
jgi:tetratricopeptide (TPR) repeat protein